MPAVESREKSFERTFADLAYTRLRDKAPGLLDHLLGFQLIQKDDDDTKAIGIFGFQLGKDLLLAPMFFLNGELKGHELLYIKSRDSFVPLQENWVNYLLNRRPQILGEEEERPIYELGLRNPDLSSYRRPLSEEKVASALTDGRFDGLEDRMSLPRWLEKAGFGATEALCELMRKDAGFAEAVLKFYDVDDFKNLKYTVIEKKAAEVKVAFIDGANPGPDAWVLTDDEKETLMTRGWMVMDKRAADEKAKVYSNKIAEAITTPDVDGFYDVLMSNGKSKTFLVISGGTAGQKDRANYCSRDDFDVWLLDPKSKKVYKTQRQSVFTTKTYNFEQMTDIFEDMTDARSVKPQDCVVFVGQEGRATRPYHILKKLTGVDDRVEYEVCEHYSVPTLPGTRLGKILTNSLHPVVNNTIDNADQEPETRRVVVTPKTTTRVTVAGDTVFVPSTFKAVVLKNEYDHPTVIGDEAEEAEELPTLASSPEIALKMANDLHTGAWRELQVRKVGSNYVIMDNGRGNVVESKTAAAKRLVCGYSMDAEDAEYVLKTAGDISSLQTKKWYVRLPLVKDAATPLDSPVFDDPLQPSNRWSGVPTYYPDTKTQSLGTQAMLGNKQQYYTNDPDLDPSLRRAVTEAADNDQKEVLDAASIAGLVKTTDTDSAVDGYMSDLLLAIDRLGRILFLFYWHNDKFKERYGQQDLLELEDNLRNSFKQLGDLSLFLKQKTVEPESALAGDVSLDTLLG